MFKTVRHHTKTRAAIAAVAATVTLGALAPGAASAADPVRPASYAIAEIGGAGHDDTIYVHGTNGVDNMEISGATYNGIPALRIRSAQDLHAGAACGKAPWPSSDPAVYCPLLRKLYVNTYDGSDSVVIFSSARNNSVEVWGGRDQDYIRVERGAYPAFLLGGDGDDRLYGSDVRESLWGGPGNDYIAPGGGNDDIDGGHGDFNASGPVMRAYTDNPTECAARTHGFWDRYNDAGNSTAEGIDTMDLSNLNRGALADVNVCRLGYFGDNALALVYGIENVIGTRYNDRLVGDDDVNVLTGNSGQDWLTGEGGADRIESQDNEVDTIKCSVGGDFLHRDAIDQKINCT